MLNGERCQNCLFCGVGRRLPIHYMTCSRLCTIFILVLAVLHHDVGAFAPHNKPTSPLPFQLPTFISSSAPGNTVGLNAEVKFQLSGNAGLWTITRRLHLRRTHRTCSAREHQRVCINCHLFGNNVYASIPDLGYLTF
jgi:hypothetical protein